jgi:hypothetical protein
VQQCEEKRPSFPAILSPTNPIASGKKKPLLPFVGIGETVSLVVRFISHVSRGNSPLLICLQSGQAFTVNCSPVNAFPSHIFLYEAPVDYCFSSAWLPLIEMYRARLSMLHGDFLHRLTFLLLDCVVFLRVWVFWPNSEMTLENVNLTKERLIVMGIYKLSNLCFLPYLDFDLRI